MQVTPRDGILSHTQIRNYQHHQSSEAACHTALDISRHFSPSMTSANVSYICQSPFFGVANVVGLHVNCGLWSVPPALTLYRKHDRITITSCFNCRYHFVV